jgi:UDP-N-acetylmuramate dehydrogenase
MNTGNLDIKKDVPLAELTSLGVGGPARYLVEAKSEDEIRAALSFAESERIPVFTLGGGTNVLVADSGFPGLVLRMALLGVQREGSGILSASAGENWDAFVESSVKLNLAGLECMSGIPGTVGGTPVQNVGAYGAEASETIVSVRVLDRQTKTIATLSNKDCQFAYRASIFNTTQRDRYIILNVTYSLRPEGKTKIRHQDLEMFFPAGSNPTLGAVRDAVLNIRAGKGMVLDENDPDSKSAGSFFKNPLVIAKTLLRMEEAARRRGCLGPDESIPLFKAAGGVMKLPAGWLIERSGFHKGYGSGKVGLSDKHTLAMVNRGGATAREMYAFMREIQAGVRGVFGIELVPELIFVGFD